jgi:Uncharacterized conserved protein
MFDADGHVRPSYRAMHDVSRTISPADLGARADALASGYTDQGVTFDIGGVERPFPLDVVPRVIASAEWETIEAGVAQRVRALEAFLADVYGPMLAVRGGVVPARLITSSPHFHRSVQGIEPANGVRIHVSGIDLVRDTAGVVRVLEDNVRVPSGVSYVITNRRAMANALPEGFNNQRIRPVSGYPGRRRPDRRGPHARRVQRRLLRTFVAGKDDGHRAGRGPGPAVPRRQGLHAHHRRASARRRDLPPARRRVHRSGALPLGLPPRCARAGQRRAKRRVSIANAIGNGVADDKLVYTFVPDLIRYYLNEQPLIPNVDTWRLEDDDSREEVMDRLAELVIKPVDGSGGKAIVIGPAATPAQLEALRERAQADPRGWIAQPLVQLSTVPTLSGDRLEPRHVDLRPFAVNDGTSVWVLPGGLTRVALARGELIVNSSQGGGSKDTWVLTASRTRPEPAPVRDQPQQVTDSVPLSDPQRGSPAATADMNSQQEQQQQQQLVEPASSTTSVPKVSAC